MTRLGRTLDTIDVALILVALAIGLVAVNV
jgi:hypothetical protein